MFQDYQSAFNYRKLKRLLERGSREHATVRTPHPPFLITATYLRKDWVGGPNDYTWTYSKDSTKCEKMLYLHYERSLKKETVWVPLKKTDSQTGRLIVFTNSANKMHVLTLNTSKNLTKHIAKDWMLWKPGQVYRSEINDQRYPKDITTM